MATRKKTVPRPTMHARITKAWYEHPLATLSAIGTAVGILAAVGPVILYGIHYFASHDELDAHKLADLRAQLWATVQADKLELGQVDAKAVALRNRVNDCDIARDKREPMTILERTACEQYRVELSAAQKLYDDTNKQYSDARAAAFAASKEK